MRNRVLVNALEFSLQLPGETQGEFPFGNFSLRSSWRDAGGTPI